MNWTMKSVMRTYSALFCGIFVGFAALFSAGTVWAHDPDAAKNPDEIYLAELDQVKSSHGGLLIGLGDKCLDVRLADPSDGTEVFIYECHGDENQRWSFFPAGVFFELRGLAGKCVQPDGTTTDQGRPRLVIGPCGGPEDRWQPSVGYPEEFTLTQASTGNCMDVQDNNPANRTPVILFPCHGGANQLWRLVGDGSGTVGEVEPNDTLLTAQYLSPEDFTLTFDPDVGSTAANTSVGIPHVTVAGSGDESYDYYSFVVEAAGDRGIFDIDHSNMDSYLRLFNSGGGLLASSDDSPTFWGEGGSVSYLDSFIEYTFAAPGLYVIEVGRCCVGPVPPDAVYELQISVGTNRMVVLNGGRFAVNLEFSTPDLSGHGTVWDHRTDDSAIFYFFNPSNLELLVKVLDGCLFNDRYWVFFAATTDVEFTLTVTDLETGATKTYHNPYQHPADAVTDTDAFAACQ